MRHRCSPLAAFALLLVQPTAVGIAPCTAGRRFYTAFGWNSNCQLAPLSEPAKGKNLSALNFTCADGGLSNVVPLVHTRSLSPASVPCTVNPHGVRDGSCSPPAGPTDSTSEGSGRERLGLSWNPTPAAHFALPVAATTTAAQGEARPASAPDRGA